MSKNEINDGGPAFPRTEVGTEGGCFPFSGMSLREYFAAHAPPPPSGWIGDRKDKNEIYAMLEWRWFYADAMLAAREGTHP